MTRNALQALSLELPISSSDIWRNFGLERFWRQINDFVAEIGESRDLETFSERALTNVGRLIPFDANAMFINTDRSGRVRAWKTLADCD